MLSDADIESVIWWAERGCQPGGKVPGEMVADACRELLEARADLREGARRADEVGLHGLAEDLRAHLPESRSAEGNTYVIFNRRPPDAPASGEPDDRERS